MNKRHLTEVDYRDRMLLIGSLSRPLLTSFAEPPNHQTAWLRSYLIHSRIADLFPSTIQTAIEEYNCLPQRQIDFMIEYTSKLAFSQDCVYDVQKQAYLGADISMSHFFQNLSRVEGHLILFIHGYNNTDSEIIHRVHKIQRALDLTCTTKYLVVPFEWHCSIHITEYRSDWRRAPEVARALFEIFPFFWQLKPSIIAHSMGNYILQLATQHYLQSLSCPKPIWHKW